MSNERWLDADTHKEVGKPKEPEPHTYYPEEITDPKEKEGSNEGPAEALLTTLIATWPWQGHCDPLLIPDMRCRWMLISGTGPGDLRGYAVPANGGSPIPVVVELKVRSRSQMQGGANSGVTTAPFKKALKQAAAGWRTTRKFYGSEFARWGGVAPMPQEAILVLAADRWAKAVSGEFMRTTLSRTMSESPDICEVRAVSVSRYRLGERRLVCIETLCVVSRDPSGMDHRLPE